LTFCAFFHNRWIWINETLFSLTKYFLSSQERPDLVLNLWVCWWVGEQWHLVQVGRIINAGSRKEVIVPLLIDPVAEIRSCFCSETVVFEKKLDEASYVVDMECFAIDFVCQKFQIPRIILKVPIDEIGEESKHFDYHYALERLENTIDWKALLAKITAKN
jgi:hypothetical protein